MGFGQIGEAGVFASGGREQRRERAVERRDEGARGGEVGGAETRARLRRVLGRLARYLGKGVAQPLQGLRQASAARERDVDGGAPALARRAIEAEPRQRVGEERNEVAGLEARSRKLGEDERKPPRRGARQRRPGGIIRRDSPARELGRDAFGEPAIGRDQGGDLIGNLERLAQRERDGERLAALVLRLDHGDAVEAVRQARGRTGRDRRAIRERGPGVGGLGGSHRLAQEPGAIGERG